MATFLDANDGRPKINSIAAAQPSSVFIALSSNQIWTPGSNSSAHHSRGQRAIHELLLTRARFVRGEIESLYRSLARIAAQAHALRDIETVEMASEIMLGLPVSRYLKNVALYYQAFCLNERRDFAAARRNIDELLDQRLTAALRSRLLLIKAATYSCAGEINDSLPFYLEAGQTARDCDLGALTTSLRMAAVMKGINGDHSRAVSDLEALIPLACQISNHEPEAFAATLNSYAVELGEIGRVEQALNVVSRVATFSRLVPEIAETIPELQSKLPRRKHSVVVIHRPALLPKSRTARAPVRKRVRQSVLIIREAERRFTSLRAPPATRRAFAPSNLALIDPARQPTKPRAP